jgi:disulfide bond formation protein DsbB
MGLFAAITRHWLWVALIVSIAMLAAANAFEHLQGLPPCHLCLEQRKAYWAAGGVALIGAAVGCTRFGPPTFRVFCLLLAAAFGFGLWQAGFQAGGEYEWWKLPESCSVDPKAGPVTVDDIKCMLDGTCKTKVVDCGKPLWWFPDVGGIKGPTMAGWNAIISLVLVSWSLIAAVRGQPKKVAS